MGMAVKTQKPFIEPYEDNNWERCVMFSKDFLELSTESTFLLRHTGLQIVHSSRKPVENMPAIFDYHLPSHYSAHTSVNSKNTVTRGSGRGRRKKIGRGEEKVCVWVRGEAGPRPVYIGGKKIITGGEPARLSN